MINEGIAIIGLVEVNFNWNKYSEKIIYIIGRTDGFKQGVLAQDII